MLGVLPQAGLEISQGASRLGTHHMGEEWAWLSVCYLHSLMETHMWYFSLSTYASFGL